MYAPGRAGLCSSTQHDRAPRTWAAVAKACNNDALCNCLGDDVTVDRDIVAVAACMRATAAAVAAVCRADISAVTAAATGNRESRVASSCVFV